ncbi:MAG TPA: glycosyltransferase [Ideonella sp.]|uniref:MraY family glycosyltransferase n=1 Tax=Ideonella sp. TaxID=1929293 RepID=UPI002E32C0F6|nr:glycosyltransferase [Ideonella sp.]HEX5686740.1 glycosyltransferase [Ideonella sp.]
MLIFLTAFLVSAGVTLLLVHSAHLHGRHSADHDFDKPQGIHAVAVPRIGGLAVVLGISAASVFLWLVGGPEDGRFAFTLLACSSVAFVAGFVQDLTEALTPRGRLLATALSAVIAYYWMGAAVHNTDIPGIDWIVSFGFGSLAVTVLAVAGIANAINIIDGLNGLASMCVALMLAALAYVAFQVSDLLICWLAVGGIGAVLGLFLWNFPRGLIFLGDGGAYFLGFFVSELSILLLVRNPNEVSPFFPLLACIYPIFETLFSIYRRWFLRSVPPSVPDGIHLHSLIYRRVMRWAVGGQSARELTRRNSMSSPYLWLLCMFSIIPAVAFWDNTPMLAVFLALFVASYLVLYWRIVRFRSPRWMFYRRPPGHSESVRQTPLDRH